MSNTDMVKRFEDVSLQIVESIRSGDGLREEPFVECEQLLESLIRQLEHKDAIPKRLAYAIQVLRDNLIGGLSAYRGPDRERIVKASSYLDCAIEKLLIG